MDIIQIRSALIGRNMKAQEVFDTVVTHLRNQKVKSMNDEGECLYRGPNGLMCAVGCLIPDDQYDPNMENNPIDVLLNTDLLQGDLRKTLTRFKSLLNKLQILHDDEAPWTNKGHETDEERLIRWEKGFKSIASKHKLVYTPST
jgi:hypothetical protein